MSIDFYKEAQQLQAKIVERRRDFHRHPEIAFEEVRTAGIVAEHLQELGLEVQTGIGKTGVVAMLEGEQDGPTVLVRADMDALPMQEANDTDYASTIPNRMHACGHDGHTSIGLAVAELLSKHRADMKGRIKFVFQPAEEIGAGAEAMIKDGVLENPRPDYTIGLHLWNDLEVGKIGITSGPAMAASDIWNCTITGHGGHGAAPHETRDPIVAAAQLITAVQSIVGRNVDPLDTAVVTIGTIHGGDAFNIIPAAVECTGTIRTYRKDTQAMVHQRLKDICEGIGQSMQCKIDLEITTMTVAVNNNPALSDKVAAEIAGLVGADNIIRDIRTMGSEDVSLLMDDIPGCYFFVGSANAKHKLDFPHHNPRFDIDEESLIIGTAALTKTAASFVLTGK